MATQETISNHKRFDRHAVFSKEDLALVMTAIGEEIDFELSNMLYGLFDGYLYNNLMTLAAMQLSDQTYKDLVELIAKIDTQLDTDE